MRMQAIGMVWYKAENYQRLRAMFEDGELLHATYEEWLSAAEHGRKTLQSKGDRVVCVDIDPEEFPKWCKDNGLRLNAQARGDYADLTAYRMVIGEADRK